MSARSSCVNTDCKNTNRESPDGWLGKRYTGPPWELTYILLIIPGGALGTLTFVAILPFPYNLLYRDKFSTMYGQHQYYRTIFKDTVPPASSQKVGQYILYY